MAFSWKLYGDGKTPPLGEAVAPDERLSWPRTIGIGAQHVVAMFGATFVFPLIMGLDANLAIMMSGVATIIFLLIVQGRVAIHVVGARAINAALPPAVTGAVVMLIGFNLAPVVAGVYWPQDQWVALATMAFIIVASLLLRGFWARISILLGLVFGFLLSWLLDGTAGPITS